MGMVWTKPPSKTLVLHSVISAASQRSKTLRDEIADVLPWRSEAMVSTSVRTPVNVLWHEGSFVSE
jgi:hypothetical protein